MERDKENIMNKKQLILNTVKELVSGFLYYDRKEDEDLLLGDIEDHVKNTDLQIEDMVEVFRNSLIKGIHKK